MRTLQAVARCRSFSAAVAELNVTPIAAGQQLLNLHSR
ncbi:LysR family transcriptional regulator [Pseudomonas brassicacearum]|nr:MULTISPECIES: LysR family transcriptional regulator [Pseudomonas]QIB03783.1 LysR family transcriptional regulator [Pseudomonas fluorescens]URM25760.1 LysR family transcriptional regulator [Pseudomonas frederiksbergensis]KAB0528527.1 LysR family transcriptional regulator [Pseudomonas brassicacearum subsp. brassicacearum]MDD2030822.1 LysR family transcriptional regulator [Pseudomonas sp. 39167]NJP59254.1 LysR family transcriptional regulator [Pseudomonas brassicacearum]